MKTRILLLVLAAALVAFLCPAAAAVAPDPDAQASLTLYYSKDGAAFADLEIGIYRVAEVLADGSFQPVEPFASWPINIQGITSQEQWNLVAQTLSSYIVAQAIAPDRETLTGADGTAHFPDLKMGLYFVEQVTAENNGGTYIFNRFLVYVPTPQADGAYLYQVEARPKCLSFTPKSQYTVTKLWQDGGRSDRPGEVTVEIYRDGVLQETQVLSGENDWTYTWYVTQGDTAQWTVAERQVPQDYRVTVSQNGSNFTVVNTRQSPSDIPQTGDTFSPLLWVALMGISGGLLLILSIYSRRHK